MYVMFSLVHDTESVLSGYSDSSSVTLHGRCALNQEAKHSCKFSCYHALLQVCDLNAIMCSFKIDFPIDRIASKFIHLVC